MWVPAAAGYLVAAMMVATQLLSPARRATS
jgi:hypothetical protein